MKKEYMNPEMLVEGVQTMGMLAKSLEIKEGTVPIGSAVAPSYDLEDDEDWGDEEDVAAGGRRKVY